MKTSLRVVAIALFAGLLACASAYALKVEIERTVVSATASVSPHAFPAHGRAPATLESVTRIRTTDGSAPPALRELVFLFDKNGAIDTRGLPTCTMAKLAESTVEVARKRCPGAIVGEGVGRAEVDFPGSGPIEIGSPLTFFNAPPVGGRPSVIVHAYEKVPVPKAVLVSFAIERIHQGRYGFRVKVPLPAIAEGYGAATLAKATIDRTWKIGGGTVGYISARCQGSRLQVHGTVTFAGGLIPGTLTSPCHTSG